MLQCADNWQGAHRQTKLWMLVILLQTCPSLSIIIQMLLVAEEPWGHQMQSSHACQSLWVLS